MTADQENSSLPLLLVISGAVLLVAIGGWYLLDEEPPPPLPPISTPASSATVPEAVEDTDSAKDTDTTETNDDAEVSVEPASEAPVPGGDEANETTPRDEAGLDIESEMLKAALAADAEIYLFPIEQSALYYYGNVLDADPDNAVANAELDAVLAEVSQTVSAHLAASEYQAAYDIAALVAQRRPGHALVVNTQQALDARTQALVEEAIALVQNGDDEAAAELLVEAESLPGHSADYFEAVRSSITEIQDVRLAAEADRQQRSALAAEQAKEAWLASVEAALEEGNLVTPAGASARDLLAEDNAWNDERAELAGRLMTRLTEEIASQIGTGALAAAESLLATAREIDGEFAGLDELEVELEAAIIAAESARVAGLDQLVRVRTVPARYPRRAEDRGISGWVDVEFTVNIEGKTEAIEVINAEPETVFDNAAIVAVEQWEFEPKVFRGETIPQRTMARLSFVLNE